MRLIDIDVFRKEHRMAEHCEDCERNSRECQHNDYFSMMDFCDLLDDAPTVDAMPVVHGKWISAGEFEACSVCGTTHLKTINTYYGKATKLWVKTNYCPNCGAKMDLEDEQ